MIDEAAVSEALEGVREILQADGGDIELVRVDGSTVDLRLIVEGSECAECVLPRPLLEDVALKLMKPMVAGLHAVQIEDPREG